VAVTTSGAARPTVIAAAVIRSRVRGWFFITASWLVSIDAASLATHRS
jgi:hypothetical protein